MNAGLSILTLEEIILSLEALITLLWFGILILNRITLNFLGRLTLLALKKGTRKISINPIKFLFTNGIRMFRELSTKERRISVNSNCPDLLPGTNRQLKSKLLSTSDKTDCLNYYQ